VLLALVVLAAAAGVIAYRWSQGQYYVADHNGTVAIYRGVQADIPGLTLSHLAGDTDLTLAALSDPYTEQVQAGIPADSLAEAHRIVTRLTGLARPCPAATPAPRRTASPSPTARASTRAGATRTPAPSASAAPSPSASPAPSPSATATLAPPDCVEAAS
jgi:protein phosphatase